MSGVANESSLIIIGAGGHGSELASYLADLKGLENEIHLGGFVDEGRPPGTWDDFTILGNFDALQSLLRSREMVEFKYITAVGNNQVRQQLVYKVEKLDAENITAWTLCHPSATLGRHVEIGLGTCLAPGCIITTHVIIGRHCILNVNTSVSHDCRIGDFVNINPRAVVCGNVHIGTGCYIGAGATVIDKVSIGEWSIIGAGAVVVDDVPPHVTAVGVPARVIKNHLGQ